MKVVIAPDSFKESLAATEVARAIGQGVLSARPDAVLDLVPMADGGEGTVEAMVLATGGRFFTADVFGPLGQPCRARFGMLGRPASAPALPGELSLLTAEDGTGELSTTAIIEMAAASGLHLVPPDRRDPLRTTTFGTGQLILAALDAGATEIILGIGGSATVDGGAGALQALGASFVDARGEACVCGLAGGGLADVARLDLSDLDPRLPGVRIRIACDVSNPLTGPDGAAAVFGPQKGATDEQVAILDRNLQHWAAVLRETTQRDVESLPGSGAAGGLGAGLVACLGATLEPGVKLVAEAVGLHRRMHGADVCITGEGRLDRTSGMGKTAVAVARIAAEHGATAICLCGSATDDAPRDAFALVRPLLADGITVREAMANAAALLKARAAEAMAAALPGRT